MLRTSYQLSKRLLLSRGQRARVVARRELWSCLQSAMVRIVKKPIATDASALKVKSEHRDTPTSLKLSPLRPSPHSRWFLSKDI